MSDTTTPTIERTTTEEPSTVVDVDTDNGNHDLFSHIVRKATLLSN